MIADPGSDHFNEYSDTFLATRSFKIPFNPYEESTNELKPFPEFMACFSSEFIKEGGQSNAEIYLFHKETGWVLKEELFFVHEGGQSGCFIEPGFSSPDIEFQIGWRFKNDTPNRGYWKIDNIAIVWNPDPFFNWPEGDDDDDPPSSEDSDDDNDASCCGC